MSNRPLPLASGGVRGYCFIKFKKHMDFDTFDTDLFQELNDMPGEIFDIEEEKFDVQEYINGNTDY